MTPAAPADGHEHQLDLDRTRRVGMPEAIYCQGKTSDQCVAIVSELLTDGRSNDAIVATRVQADQLDGLVVLRPSVIAGTTLTWRPRPASGTTVAVVCAGVSDITVADEARATLEALGHTVISRTDVGVAGLHRLTDALPDLEQADIVIAVAGMEGALATVLAGLIPQPIVAVPTSAGYGTSFEGMTALLSMAASCAPGIALVGIDNGYGAACVAHRMATLRERTT
jgi:hypothetical protein